MSQKKLKRLRQIQEKVKEVEVFEKLPKFWEIIKNDWKYLLIISVIGFFLFANGLKGDYVSDDYASITQNTSIDNFGFMFNKANSMSLMNYFVNLFFGFTSSAPFHLASVFCLLIFNILAYVLVYLVTNNKLVSRLSLLLFVFHPIHVEAVTWISGRIYLILGIYICLSLINFIYYLDTGKYKYLIWSALFFLLGFLTDKPRPFAVFLLMGLYLVFLGWNRVKDKLSKLIGPAIVAIIVLVIVAWPYITTRVNIVNSGYNVSDGIFYNPLFQYPTAVPKYLQLLWFPVDLTLYHTMYVAPNWLNWLILINYLALVIYFYFKDKRYFWALSFIFLATAPSMTPIKVSWLVADRYIFLGSLGFCVFIALLMADHWSKLKIVVPTILVSILVYFGIRIYSRNIDWQTNHNLWVNTCQVSPNSHNAWNNIGDDYDKLKQYNNAIKGFTQSVIVKPNYADAYHNRANIFFKTGRLDLARESYDTALKFSPALYQTYLSLTQIDLMEKKGDLALGHASKAVELQPTDPQASYVLGVVLAQIGRVTEAETIFKNILKQVPDYKAANQALQQLKMAVGNSK